MIEGIVKLWRTGIVGLVGSAKTAPLWFSVTAALTALQAILPALQFFLVQQLLTRNETSDIGDMAGTLTLLAILVGLVYPLAQLSAAASQRMGVRVKAQYRILLLESVAKLTPKEIADSDTVTEMEAADQAVGVIDDLGAKALQLLGAIGSSVFLTAALWTIDFLAGILIFSSMIPTIVAFSLVAKREAVGWGKYASAERRGRYLMELLLQQRTASELSTLGAGMKIAKLAAIQIKKSAQVLDAMISFAMRMESVAALTTAVLFVGVIIRVVIISGSTAGVAAAIVAVIAGLNSIRQCGYAAGTLISASPKLESYQKVVSGSGLFAITELVASADEPDRITELEVRGLFVQYPASEEPAVRKATLEASQGEMIAVVGMNGAGKTTLMNAIVGARGKLAGNVLLDGADADTWEEERRQAVFGLLTQEFGRYEISIREALMLGTRDFVQVERGDEELWSALSFAHLEEFVRRLPDGLDTLLGEQWGGVGISGGQWQRLALARLSLRDSPIWILDEPTSSLDAEVEQQIFDTLRARANRQITIVVSHRASTLQDMDRIYVMSAGEVVQVGKFDELVSDRAGQFYTMFQHQLFEGEH